MTEKTKIAATSARTVTIATNSPNPNDSFGDFDAFQRNLGVGLFIILVCNRATIGGG
jgi:hypothetical protein